MHGIVAPAETGYRCDRISRWWKDQWAGSTTGPAYVRPAAGLAWGKGRGLKRRGFDVTGVGASESMVELARKNHPGSRFVLADICRWQPPQEYDVIVAWDSTFRTPCSARTSRSSAGRLREGARCC